MEFSRLTEVTTACKSTLICYVISDKVLSFQPTESAVPAEEGGDCDEQRCDGVHGDGGGEVGRRKMSLSGHSPCPVLVTRPGVSTHCPQPRPTPRPDYHPTLPLVAAALR